ncbi:HEAT repeat domain-containing protein [Fulvivirgaceae bacterium BMA12]|uniref:HEAT repeat domain-containing protein n=1 Tax=Agaribacillus aureus TaxID=3051825 RepID=A0ABT8LDQ9_9BACT|nr:HEAT repeat domain-containing protein [Fulvivirgaceae bacterium BMA12]
MSRKNWTYDKLFFRLLNNKSKNTYWENIGELRRRPNNEVHSRAVQLSKSKIEKEKIIGIDVLAQLGFDPRFKQKETIDIYFELLQEEQTPKVLGSILSGIGHNNENLTDKQIQKLCEFECHNFSDVRFSLVHALSRVENKNAIQVIINLSQDKHPEVRDWATFALGSQIEITNEKIINALWDRLGDEFTNVRFEAIAGLANRKDKRIKEILIQELKEIDNHGSLILESIESLNDKDFIELIEKQIKKNKETKKVNEKWLLDCIEKLKTNAQQKI